MIALTNKISAYLIVNNIPSNGNDYCTGIPPNGQDQILYWNEEKLGPEPTEQQLNSSYVIWEGQQIAQENKQKASQLLQETDWTCTVDITNPEYSNPYLMNQDAFLAYRSQVRAIAVNPPTIPAVFPTKPNEEWSTE